MAREFIIVGGGVAGLSAAWALGQRGAQVTLVERERLLGAGSTGRSAAIFRCLDLTPGGCALALRSAALLDGLLGRREHWLARTGVLYVAASMERLRPLLELAGEFGREVSLLERDELTRVAPELHGSDVTHGLICHDEGVVDVHAVMEALADHAKSSGARLRLESTVARCLVDRRVCGVSLGDGTTLEATDVVICGGAEAASLGATAGAPLPLVPRGRHLVFLDGVGPRPRPPRPVWRLDAEVYFRAESGGVLASPCDESAPEQRDSATEAGLTTLCAKLEQTAPSLANLGVRRAWVGLRTFAADRGMVVGADPRVPGLFWLAGLGGHGISAGVAAGHVLANCVFGDHDPLADRLTAARLLSGSLG